jgi:hypothetical protein
MKLEVKSAVILLTTFALGIAVGLVGQGALQRARLGPAGRPPGFVARMEEVLQLRADQQATVRPVLEATAGRNQQVIDATRAQLRTIVDSMAVTLAPQLDDAQRKRLDQRIRELPDPFRPGGPPGGGPRGGGPAGPPPR